jgi:hypothetical protein
MKHLRFPFWTVLSLLLIAPLIAATEYGDCADIVNYALDATKSVCNSTGRNQACYGHVLLDAQAQPGMGPLQFNKVGDRIDLTRLDSLRLSPMDIVNQTWGVALLKLQADIPDQSSSSTNVSLLLFGDVQITNAIRNPVTINVSVRGKSNLNVRRQPNNQAFVITTLLPGVSVVANGRNEDGSWISVELPNQGGNGWVTRSLIESDGDLDTLNISRPDLAGYGPMQAFYLKTGKSESTCAQASDDGILVQTPEGVAQVRLWINEVRIRLGSTAFIQARPNNQMAIKTVEGEAHVEAMGVEQTVPAGTGVTVQMNANLAAVAPPSRPEAYMAQDVSNLPVQNLDRPITIAPPLEVSDQTPGEEAEVESTLEVTLTETEVPANQDSSVDQPTNTPIVLSLTPDTVKSGQQLPPPPPPTDTPAP